MTAEIAVMNRQGIALAADSAVSIRTGSGPKIYQSANKIFALSKYEPVAVMIYNNATLLGLPWETVIKSFREDLKKTSFPKLEDYGWYFLEHLGGSQKMFPGEVQKSYVDDYIDQYFSRDLLSAINEEAKRRFEKDGVPITPEAASAIAEKVIKLHHGVWNEAKRLPTHLDDATGEVLSSYEALIVRAIRRVFKKIELSEKATAQLFELATWFFTREPPFEVSGTTGVVVAGYGTNDLLPSFIEFEVDGIACNRAVAWVGRSKTIGRDMESSPAVVSAFAQTEMVARFMTGVDPQYQGLIEDQLGGILSGYTNAIYKVLGSKKPSAKMRQEIDVAREAMLDEYASILRDIREENFVRSIIDAVGSLPIDRLAEMAESLVDLTSFKRKVSIEDESVGGPIDVAVITPGDGMIWIKRKHYFERDKNPQFFANYYREV